MVQKRTIPHFKALIMSILILNDRDVMLSRTVQQACNKFITLALNNYKALLLAVIS